MKLFCFCFILAMTSSTSCLSLTYDVKPDISGIRFWHLKQSISKKAWHNSLTSCCPDFDLLNYTILCSKCKYCFQRWVFFCVKEVQDSCICWHSQIVCAIESGLQIQKSQRHSNFNRIVSMILWYNKNVSSVSRNYLVKKFLLTLS